MMLAIGMVRLKDDKLEVMNVLRVPSDIGRRFVDNARAEGYTVNVIEYDAGVNNEGN